MRISKQILAFTLSLFVLGGCSDFLDRPEHNMTASADLDNIASLSASIYYSFRSTTKQQGHALLAMGEVASDNALRGSILSGGGGTDATKLYNQFQNFTSITPTSTNYIEWVWDGLYPVISQANVNIRAIESLFSSEDETTREAFKAENRVIRAWCYIFLVNTFGQVPILPEDDITPAEYAELTNDKTVLELYDYIIEDLRYAVEHIPSKQEWFDIYGLSWQGRNHLGSAQGLLAKALLYKAANEVYFNADEEAAKACYTEIVQIVETMELSYTLATDYEQIFREEGNYSTESLMEIGTLSTADGTTAFYGFQPIQPRNFTGSGFMGPTLNLINQYECDDEGVIIDDRYRGTVLFGETVSLSGMEHPGEDDFMRNIYGYLMKGNVSSNETSAGWPNRWCRKIVHDVPVDVSSDTSLSDNNFGGNNLKLLRWGELLLIGAEAAYHIGEEAKAIAWLTTVRDRALLTRDISSLTGQTLIDQIWADKRLEIALEWSNRYFELVRIDKIYSGYMKWAIEEKVDDEFAGIKNYLDINDAWDDVYSDTFPMTSENYQSLIPLCSGLSIPKHYTLPIASDVFNEMLTVQQTTFYR